MKVFDVTLVLDTNAYADGDVLVVPQEIDGVFADGPRKLVSVTVLDEIDVGQAIDLVFMDADGTVGTINAAVTISDADARKILGIVAVAAADYKDMINSKVATKTGIDLVLAPASAAYSLWIAAVARGAGTWAAAGIRLKLGFE